MTTKKELESQIRSKVEKEIALYLESRGKIHYKETFDDLAYDIRMSLYPRISEDVKIQKKLK